MDAYSRRYAGHLSVEEIRRFDDMQWLEVWTPADLETFREGSFAGPAREMPPIIVVTYPDKDGTSHTEIRDGRGRVNFANAYALRLHVWHLTYTATDFSVNASSQYCHE